MTAADVAAVMVGLQSGSATMGASGGPVTDARMRRHGREARGRPVGIRRRTQDEPDEVWVADRRCSVALESGVLPVALQQLTAGSAASSLAHRPEQLGGTP